MQTRHFTAFFVLLLGIWWVIPAEPAATILPPGQTCFQATTGINGQVGALGPVIPGSGGTSGTYAGVPLTGGSGSGATANVVVSAGGVSSVTILNPGTQYVTGDVLSAAPSNIGNTSSFSVPVLSTTINSSLAGGSVAFYIPNTSSTKQTWKDAAQTMLNTNPVQLNQNGCALIYGTGSYRQVVQDNLGNTIWDAVTTDTSANNNTFWAGLAGGTPNVITVTDPGFNGTDGSIINFIALSTNTGATTLNPSSFGATSVLKATTAGLVALTGGEIIAGNPISVIYSAAGGTFTLLNTVIQSASGAQAPLCGASGLKVTNGVTASSQIQITARNLVMVSASGLTINRSNVNLTLSITSGTSVTTPNGMDGESPGTSAWINAFAIDNGAAPASLGTLASGNGQAPVLPSGYSYQCYLGAMWVNSSGNLVGSQQLGNKAQWIVGGSGLTNSIALLVTHGTAGTYSVTSPILANVPLSSWAPPTATRFQGIGSTSYTNTGSATNILIAPNANYGTGASNNNGPLGTNGGFFPIWFGSAGATQQGSFDLELEGGASGGLYWASGGTGGSIGALGWTDAVNAN